MLLKKRETTVGFTFWEEILNTFLHLNLCPFPIVRCL
jgi:hypothetical protein